MHLNAWPFLLLLPLVPALLLLHARSVRRRRAALAALVDQPLAARVLPHVPERARWLRTGSLAAAVGLLVLALAQPQWPGSGPDTVLRGRDIVVLMDVSLSMLAEEPSRLARAKQAARALAEALRAQAGNRLALLTFAGRADVACPPTRDTALFLDRLDAASVEEVGQRGSAVGSALLQLLTLLPDLEPAYTDVILLSDGEDHRGQPIEAARLLGLRGYALHTMTFGSGSEALPISITGADGRTASLIYEDRTVLTRARPGVLTAMADAAGGVHVTGGNEAALPRLYREVIAPKPRRNLDAGTERELDHRFQPFIGVAILMLVLEAMLRDRAAEVVT